MTTPATHWSTSGGKTVITGPTNLTMGYIRQEPTPMGPRWFAMRADGAYATPQEGRVRHRDAAADFLAAVEAGEIE